MTTAKLKPKPNSVFKAVINPPVQQITPPGINPETGEVLTPYIVRESRENVENWFQVFIEMGIQLPDWKPQPHRTEKRRSIA